VSARIRRATRDDTDAIARLWRELLDLHAGIDPVHGLRGGGGAALAVEVRRALGAAAAALWVAEQHAGVVGFCLARHEQAPPLAVEASRVVVTELLVERTARRRGIGRALVAAALDWARAGGAARVEVRVAARNAEGQAFWRAQGFGDFVDVLDRRL
jgi:GNAT superfamily N-acetyltransferase